MELRMTPEELRMTREPPPVTPMVIRLVPIILLPLLL
jgi:hypothetical protein